MVAAPSELPPPKPAPTGIRFCSAADNPETAGACGDERAASWDCKAEAALTMRLEASVGMAGSSQRKRTPGSLAGEKSKVSKSATVTIHERRGWNPSGVGGPTRRCKFIFAGAETRMTRLYRRGPRAATGGYFAWLSVSVRLEEVQSDSLESRCDAVMKVTSEGDEINENLHYGTGVSHRG